MLLNLGGQFSAKKLVNFQRKKHLQNADRKLYILSAGKLKNKLYGAVRLTLQMLMKEETTISRLVFPEDLLDDRKTAPDLFEKSRSLITSLILRFLNQMLTDEKKKKEILSLRVLAKDSKKVKAFYQKIEDFIDREAEEVYQIGAGGMRNRLNETLRLTLLKWQPSLQSRIEEVVIAGPETPENRLKKKAGNKKNVRTSKPVKKISGKSLKTKKK